MNNDKPNQSSQLENMSIGDVLASMIDQFNSENNGLAIQAREIGQTTVSSLNQIAGTVVSGSQSNKASFPGKDLLNAFNPVGGGSGSSILTSLFLGPVWKGLFSLFSGGSDAQPTPLAKYAFPQDVRTNTGAYTEKSGGLPDIRSNAFGLSETTQQAASSINISIQALDARSILDRSDDIASALKQALLSNHDVTDNLNEI